MIESPNPGCGDADLVALLRKHDFCGPFWELYADYLADHGTTTVTSLIASRKIFAEMHRREIKCCGPVVIDGQDAADLAVDAVANAIEPFRKMLKGEEWNPHGPASLRTAFIDRCLREFPNVYRTWMRKKFGGSRDQERRFERLEVLPGDEKVAGRAEEHAYGDPYQALISGDPEATLISREQQLELLALVPDNLRAVLQLVIQGYPFTQAAAAHGEDPKKLRRQLDRIRPRLRRIWIERNEETDP
jgi:DNA-directed RNA polymerase specialized sigma24 family protein